MKITARYKHIFFDLDHTLWDFETNAKAAMQHTLQELGILSQLKSFPDFYALYSTINDRLWDEYRKGETSKAELTEQRFSEPFAHFNINNVSPKEVNDYYLSSMAEQTTLMPGCIDLLNYLKSKSYQLHIITNGFIEVQQKKLESSNIAEYFNTVTMSEMAGFAKPKPQVFQFALKNANARKLDSCMIGDDWANDILGAVNVGLDAILYRSKLDAYPELKLTEVNSNKGEPIKLELAKQTKQRVYYCSDLRKMKVLF